MADGVYITEIFNLFPELPELIQRAVIKATKKAAFDIQRRASTVYPYTRQSGFLASSVYVEVNPAAGASPAPYGQGVENIPDGATLLPEVEPPEKATIAYIAVGANYGLFVEMGTIHAAPFPYLVPAAEAIFPAYEAALKALEDTLELP